MNLLVKNIIGIFLILALLPATSGVMVFHHICNTSHTHTVSIFSKAKCDNHEETTGICEHCLKNIHSCTLEKNTHCIEYTEFLSIEADFVITDKQLIKVNKLILPEKEFYEIQFLCFHENNYGYNKYIQKDIKKPLENIISAIIFNSQFKSGEDTSELILV
ncbi:hypothetical protein D9V86_11990 [Bacteroidetes/Chlorobi group bacterium ChocPot_Mid]|jgi:hypothetical protein|nr:MAG: hypothetical protein D9V86_11990 [Bacteroidetes/Chlorobi group bacterium ChocPot_Mid]